jgi:peptidoglycan hydrolase-like protein with peptidoglycan-binding domain
VKPSPERISEIQSALARGGYYHGDPNGKWDASTVDAMRKFQEDHGLDGTGKLDALSLQKLGLGSEIAGVDAPHPPTQHTAPPAQATPAPAGTNPDKPKPQTPKSPDSGVANPTGAPAPPASKPTSPSQPS